MLTCYMDIYTNLTTVQKYLHIFAFSSNICICLLCQHIYFICIYLHKLALSTNICILQHFSIFAYLHIQARVGGSQLGLQLLVVMWTNACLGAALFPHWFLIDPLTILEKLRNQIQFQSIQKQNDDEKVVFYWP